jgi:hypothetical protein
MPRLQVILFFALATLSVPAFGQSTNQARPGTLNYIEGNVSIGARPLSAHSVGKFELQPGQTLTTTDGKAEILLTPGVFVRIGDDSALKMISPNLTHTEIELDRGQASVEVDELYKQNNLLIAQNGIQTQLLKTGLYEFNANNNTVRVFNGKAAVLSSSNPSNSEQAILVKGGHQLALTGDAVKPQDFDKNEAKDDLYNWSSLRSQYLGEANLDLASAYAGAPGFYPGWFWNTGLYGYTWLPADGFLWSPFGFGFYSPYYIYGGGFIYGRGRYGRGGYAAGYSRVSAVRGHAVGAFSGRGGFSGGGSHGGGGGHR